MIYSGGGNRLSSNHRGFTLAEGATHVAMLNSQRRFGFTLAEVLVTLGIIGVVSAMTVPSLMQNYQRQSYVTQLHKVYNEIQQAAVSQMNSKNALNLVEAGINSQTAANNFIKDNFKVVQTCTNALTPCFASSYKLLSGSALSGHGADRTSYVIASGASIRPGYYYGSSYGSVINLLIDINGPKGPNIVGRDLFNIGLYPNGMLDEIEYGTVYSAPLTKEQRDEIYTRKCNVAGGAAMGCFGKILNDGWEMNY